MNIPPEYFCFSEFYRNECMSERRVYSHAHPFLGTTTLNHIASFSLLSHSSQRENLWIYTICMNWSQFLKRKKKQPVCCDKKTWFNVSHSSMWAFPLTYGKMICCRYAISSINIPWQYEVTLFSTFMSKYHFSRAKMYSDHNTCRINAASSQWQKVSLT